MDIYNNTPLSRSSDEEAHNLLLLAYHYRKGLLSTIENTLLLCEDKAERFDCLKRLLIIYNEKPKSSLWVEHKYKTFGGFVRWHIVLGEDTTEQETKVTFDSFAQDWALNWVKGWIEEQLDIIGPTVIGDKWVPLQESISYEEVTELMDGFDEIDESDGEPDEVWFLGTYTEPNVIADETEVETVPKTVYKENGSVYMPPLLYIKPVGQNALLKALSPFIEDNQHIELETLLRGEAISNPILVHHQQNSLAHLFRQAMNDGYIETDKTRMRDCEMV